MAKEQVSSILRALSILECFMDTDTEWTLKALVEHLDLPTTTVFRQVSTPVSYTHLDVYKRQAFAASKIAEKMACLQW